MGSQLFHRFSAAAAFAIAGGGVAYSLAFVIGVKAESRAATNASWVLLMIGGLLGIVIVVALYERLRATDQSFALVALLLGVLGAAGSLIHGGFQIALALRPTVVGEIPNPIDPRGLLTFGLTGVAILIFSLLINAGAALPRDLGTLGTALGTLLVLTYLGRLFVYDPNNVVLLGVAALAGLVAHPLWYIRLGRALAPAGDGAPPPNPEKAPAGKRRRLNGGRRG